jgi:adenosylcobinamide-GDP ribazoletransferase
MKTAESEEVSGENSIRSGLGALKHIVAELRLAAAFLTIVPVLPAQPASDDDVAGSLGWFPAVGFALGGLLALEDLILRSLVGAELRSALLVMTLAIVTGAVHLDGLADTVDALGAGCDRTRALEILRDSRVGSFGAIALFFVLTLKIIALSAIGGGGRYPAIWFAPAIARWAMVGVAFRMNYLRAAGAGSAILNGAPARNLVLASATIAAAIVITMSLKALVVWIAAAVAVTLIRAFYARWLDGVTGDLIGAVGEVIEALVLIAMTG